MLRSATQFLALVTLVWGLRPVPYGRPPDHPAEEQPLPRSVMPLEYLLELRPRIPEGHLNGSVHITLKCLQRTGTIVLHAYQDLQVHNISYTNPNGDDVAVTEVTRNETTSTLTLGLAEDLQEGETYRLRMEFDGGIRNAREVYWNKPEGGFTMNNYLHESEDRRWFGLFTASARHVFPCFDEPFFKANFKIRVGRSLNMTALTVAPWEFLESTDEEGYVLDHFEQTPRIAPQSVGVIVADFGNTETININSSQGSLELLLRNVRFAQTTNLKGNTKLVSRVVEELQDYLGIAYPLRKLDIVALPGYMFGTQSDSLGLIVKPETFVNDRNMDLQEALVRQWVGHIVTPETRKDTKVAKVLISFLVRHLERKVLNYQNGLRLDSKQQMYDDFASNNNFSYYGGWPNYDEKGVWFFEMLNVSLGENTLRMGLKNFLNENQFGTLTEAKLWAAVTQAAGPEVPQMEEVARTWTAQRYPVLTITRQYDDGSAAMEQHVFSTQLPRAVPASDEQLLWWLPVAVLSPGAESPRPATWMGTRHLQLTGLPDATQYIVVNHDDSGMFVVNYDVHNWRLLQQNLAQLPSKTRAKLLHDALLLAAGGELDYGVALNMTARLGAEQDSAVWMALLRQLPALEALYSFTRVQDKLDAYFRNLLAGKIDPETYPNSTLNSDYWYRAKNELYRRGYQPRINEAREILQDTMPTFLINDTNTQLVLFCPEFMRDGSPDFEEQVEKLRIFMAGQYEIRSALERGLAHCPGYEQLINRMLNSTLDEDVVFTLQTWYTMCDFLTSSYKAKNLTLEFFFRNYKQLKYRYYFMKDMWTHLMAVLTASAKTQDSFVKLTEFYKEHEHKLGYTQSVVANAIKLATNAYEWGRRNLEDIEFWLDHVLPSARAEWGV